MLYKDIKISYELTGTGKTIVFLHGFLESKEMWNPIIANFKNHQLLTIDLLGQGDSGILCDTHTMEDQSNMVLFLLEKLQINKAIFVGHSMGGYVAMNFLENYPEKVEAIVLQNATTFPDSDERKTIRTRFNDLLDKNFDTTISMSIANLFSAEFRENNPTIIEETQKTALKTPINGVKAAQNGMKLRKDTTQTWKNTLVKKCLILGEKDEILDFKLTQEIATKEELHLLPHGHMSHLEDKELLVKIYQDFFSSIG